jgi:hypothetical protein
MPNDDDGNPLNDPAAIAYQDPVMVRKAQTQEKNRRYASKVAAPEKFGLAPAAAKTTTNNSGLTLSLALAKLPGED